MLSLPAEPLQNWLPFTICISPAARMPITELGQAGASDLACSWSIYHSWPSRVNSQLVCTDLSCTCMEAL